MTNENKPPLVGQPIKKEEPKPEQEPQKPCKQSFDNKNVELITNCIIWLALIAGGFLLASVLLFNPCH